jgi:hypothetical protein
MRQVVEGCCYVTFKVPENHLLNAWSLCHDPDCFISYDNEDDDDDCDYVIVHCTEGSI